MTFAEFCKTRGVDAAALTPEEKSFALKLYGVQSAPEVPLPESGKDANGDDIKVGDYVTLKLKVTCLHTKAGSAAHSIPELTVANLTYTVGDEDIHLITLNTAWLTKAI